MPRSRNTNDKQHLRITDVALPYITNTSVIDPDPHYVLGSHDVLTSIDGTATKRPGWTRFPTAASPFAASSIKRYFFWQQSTSAEFIFISVISAADSLVYKHKIGTDTDWVSIHSCSTNQEPFDYTVSHGFVFFSNGTDNKKYNGTTVTNWGIAAPTLGPGLNLFSATGRVPNHIGHSWAYTFGVAATGYISDISPVTTLWPSYGEDNQWTVAGSDCTDAQCDLVHVYRTEDGGATLYELSNSPIAYVSGWSLVDNDRDYTVDTGETALNFSSPAPLPGVNSVPPPMFRPTIYAGRVWGFKDDKVFFSTLEENNTSVPEMCFGVELTNSYRFGRTVKGLGVAGDYLIIFTNRGIFKVGGDTLATFYRSTLSKNLGLRYRQNVADYEGDLVWLDSSNTVRITDGNSVGKPDLSLPIRPDIASIDHSQASLSVYDDGLRTWIILMDGAAGKLYLFDTDKKHWMPPWNISGITAIGSNVVFSSSITLQLARSGCSMKMAEGTSTEDPVSGTVSSATVAGFTSELRLNLFPINTDNPTGISSVEYIAVERNKQPLSDVSVIIDDKPSTGTYRSLWDNEREPPYRVAGAGLREKQYPCRGDVSPGQRMSVKLQWSNAQAAVNPIGDYVEIWQMYSIDVAYRAQN